MEHSGSGQALDALRHALSDGGAADAEDRGDRLYLDWYLRAVPDPQPDPYSLAALSTGGALRVADAGDRRFEAGWRVHRCSGTGLVEVRRDGRSRVVDRADVLREDGPCLPLRGGDPVQVIVRDDLLDDNGFYYSFLDGWDPSDPPQRILRVYVALRRAGRSSFLAALTGSRPPVPLSLKIGATDLLAGRPDAAVVYAPLEAADEVTAHVVRVTGELQDVLGDRVPPLTLPLVRGVGAAEDPADPEYSFGTHRCAVIAALASALLAEGDADGLDDRTLTLRLEKALTTAGIDPRRPWRSLDGAWPGEAR